MPPTSSELDQMNQYKRRVQAMQQKLQTLRNARPPGGIESSYRQEIPIYEQIFRGLDDYVTRGWQNRAANLAMGPIRSCRFNRSSPGAASSMGPPSAGAPTPASAAAHEETFARELEKLQRISGELEKVPSRIGDIIAQLERMLAETERDCRGGLGAVAGA